jgi:hypothetical protein
LRTAVFPAATSLGHAGKIPSEPTTPDRKGS